MFPGDETTVNIEVHNGKFLPVIWMEVFFPLAKNLCLIPEETRKPDNWEQVSLRDENASVELVGEKRFSFFLWYETALFSVKWTAKRRGVYSTRGWRLRTGDGFGLAQIEQPIDEKDVQQFLVYPQLIPVSPELFLRNLWTADTGFRGVIEDPTVIRSTRNYMSGDPMKQINWRLAARGLPLTVNIYEDILPKSVHFIFDGESFNGPEPHREELEESLSILASEAVRLSQEQVRCGLTLPAGSGSPARNVFAAENPVALLQLLAAYEWSLPIKTEETSNPIFLPSKYDETPVYDAAMRTGRFYYIAYDTAHLADCRLLRHLGPNRVTLLTYTPCTPYASFETLCLQQLREGDTHV